MFHAEKLKYAPLQGSQLIYVGSDEKVAFHLGAYCREFQIDFFHAPNSRSVMDLISDSTFNYVLVDEEKLDEIPQAVRNGSEHWRLVVLQEAFDGQSHEFAVVTMPAGNNKEESALKILDKILSLREVPVHFNKTLEPVSFAYLCETFAGQEDRYRDLLVMMQNEFAEVKNEIDQALKHDDLERFREFKHKIQPSANYLQLKDFVKIMELVKLNFHHLEEADNNRLAEKMMRYFDSVLSALHKELNA